MARTLKDNSLITKLEAKIVEVIPEFGTSHTFLLSDAYKIIKTTNNGAVSIVIPNNTTLPYPIGTTIMIEHWGTGILTFSGEAGVTLNGEAFTIEAPFRAAFIRKDAINTWIVEGNLGNTSSFLLSSGTYTPTITNVTNVAASTAYTCVYSGIGDIVTVAGQIDIDPTATGNTELVLSFPNIGGSTAGGNVGGTAFCQVIAGLGIGISSAAASAGAKFKFNTTDVSNNSFFFTFAYQVIAI